MKKIVIVNAYGDKNIGDSAILHVAIDFIKMANPECHISILCEDVNSISDFVSTSGRIKSLQMPYGYAIRGGEKVSSLRKIIRFFSINFRSACFMVFDRYFQGALASDGFYSYIEEIKNADLIVSMGGGYFSTQSAFKDYFGLVLTVLPIYVAKFYKKKIIFLPISFGPFASRFQGIIAESSLKNAVVMSRDSITLNKLRKISSKYNLEIFFAPDLALFFENFTNRVVSGNRSKYIVLTARKWGSKGLQIKYQKVLVDLINYTWSRYKLKTVFLPMAKNKIEDDDNEIALNLKSKLQNTKYFSIANPRSLSETHQLIARSKLSVCMRMHSVIFSINTGTPFIAIGYGDKTLGLAKDFGVTRWLIDVNSINLEVLKRRFDLLNKQAERTKFISHIATKDIEVGKYKRVIINHLVA